jgi:hypothetical protein
MPSPNFFIEKREAMAKTVEIVYPVCCGMDVHKNFLVACIAITNEQSHTERKIKRFSTYSGDLRR